MKLYKITGWDSKTQTKSTYGLGLLTEKEAIDELPEYRKAYPEIDFVIEEASLT